MPKTPFTSKKKFSRLLHIVHFQMYRAMFSTVSLSTAVLFFLMWASSSHKELQMRSWTVTLQTVLGMEGVGQLWSGARC